MMKPTAATTLSSAVAALSLVAFPALAEKSAAPTPTLHGLSHTVTELEGRVAKLEQGLSSLKTTSIQQTSYQAGSSSPTAPRTYIIQTGDTVSEIARRHDVSRSSLMSANQLKEGQQIYIGDEIIIPAGKPKAGKPSHNYAGNEKTQPKPEQKTAPAPTPAPKPASPGTTSPQFITYKVKQGDSLSRIARRNNVSIDDIVRVNKLNNANQISINQSLRIPVSGSTAPSQPSSAPAPTPSYAGTAPSTPDTNRDDFGVYTVQKGDTLWSLSRDFFTSQQEIQQLNKMGRSTILRPGQELVVPTKKYFEYHSRLSQSS